MTHLVPHGPGVTAIQLRGLLLCQRGLGSSATGIWDPVGTELGDETLG